ncbi:MAG TPA: adenylyltransferase/cytidyltransferase family protein [Chloroflexota bacterium]|nr:adenylyltransferase/cytidyltransferase family protein [Chloroflexota bacterium]
MGRIVPFDVLSRVLAAERAAGKRIVLTNGCFDLLHVGHTRLLQQCRALGEVVVVGLNADESVRRLKGNTRPVVPEAERAELLAALAAVDYVTIFAETTAERLAAVVRPDVYVKGADYACEPQPQGAQPAGEASTAGTVDERRLPEAKVVRAGGGEVVLLPLVPGRSTTATLERLRSRT